jgi:hypothetical protein
MLHFTNIGPSGLIFPFNGFLNNCSVTVGTILAVGNCQIIKKLLCQCLNIVHGHNTSFSCLKPALISNSRLSSLPRITSGFSNLILNNLKYSNFKPVCRQKNTLKV